MDEKQAQVRPRSVSRPLGIKQAAVLQELKSERWHGQWSAGCGWIYNTVSETVTVLESLRKRGLVSKARVAYPALISAERTYPVWTITDLGRNHSLEGGR